MDSRLGPVENTTVNEDPTRNDTDKNIHDCSDSSSYYSKVDRSIPFSNPAAAARALPACHK